MDSRTLNPPTQLNRYAREFLRKLSDPGCKIELPATREHPVVSINNPPNFTIHGRLSYARADDNFEKTVLEGVYARGIECSGDDAERMRVAAGIVLPLHRCAQSLGLQAAIDYDGRTIRAPGVSLRGKFEEERWPEFLDLVSMARKFIDGYTSAH